MKKSDFILKADRVVVFIILSVSFLSLVSAIPPVLQNSEFGLSITTGVVSPLKENSDNIFSFHYFNASNGLSVVNVGCNLHIYYDALGHVYEQYNGTPANNNEVTYSIPLGSINRTGDYSYVLFCNNSVQGGFLEAGFEVTQTGKTSAFDNTILSIVAMVISYFLIFFGFKREGFMWVFLGGTILVFVSLYLYNYGLGELSFATSPLVQGLAIVNLGIAFISLFATMREVLGFGD